MNPEGRRKNSLYAFVTADPVAAGKRQEANSRSTIQRHGEFRGGGRGLYIDNFRVRVICPKKLRLQALVPSRNWITFDSSFSVIYKMAEQFVGMTVSLKLSNNAQLKGTVSNVDSTTQILHLRDGMFTFIVIQFCTNALLGSLLSS
jgi:hypothetical protein